MNKIRNTFFSVILYTISFIQFYLDFCGVYCNSQSMEQKTTMKIDKVTALLVLVLICIVLGLGLLFFSLSKSSPSTKQPTKPATGTAPLPGAPGTYSLPISMAHPNIDQATFTYTVGGFVTSITPTSLTLSSINNAEALPVFPITASVIVTDDKNTPTTISKITKGSFTILKASYDMRKRAWTVSTITLKK